MANDRIGVPIISYNFTQEQLDFLCGDGKWNGALTTVDPEDHKRPSQILGN